MNSEHDSQIDSVDDSILPETTEESLRRTHDEAEWSWLSPHAKRGVVIWVAATIDIVKAGLAISQDDREKVEDWLKDGALAKPTPNEIEKLDLAPAERFECLIVQPFVLVQRKTVH